MAEGKLEIDDPLEIKKTEDDKENLEIMKIVKEKSENENQEKNNENLKEENNKKSKII